MYEEPTVHSTVVSTQVHKKTTTDLGSSGKRTPLSGVVVKEAVTTTEDEGDPSGGIEE